MATPFTSTDDHAKLELHHDLENAASNERLSAFREAVGITDVVPLAPGFGRRSAKNIGLFKRVVRAEKSAQFQYYFFACLINACLLLQIVFAAALTALGAASGSHTQITVLGAANTVIAGLLSFTKGQGLPNKLHQYQNTLRKVREYIEQRERDFSQLDCGLDLNHEIRAVIDLYEAARQNDENNDPNAYHNPLQLSSKPWSESSGSPDKLASIATLSKLARDHIAQSKEAVGEERAATVKNEQGSGDDRQTKRVEAHDRQLLTEVAKTMLGGKHNW